MLAHKLRSSKGFVMLVVCIAVFTDVFLYGLIVPVLPFSLSERLGLPENKIQRWNSILLGTYGAAILVGSCKLFGDLQGRRPPLLMAQRVLSAYDVLIAFAHITVLFGWIGDRLQSRKMPFVLGLFVLGGATLLFALGTSLAVLLIARILQGLSTAMVFTVGFALLFDKVGKSRIGEAMGYTSMSLSLGLFLGPIIGGVIYQSKGYSSVFVPAFALVGLEILLRFLVIEEDRWAKGTGSLEGSKCGPTYGTIHSGLSPPARDSSSSDSSGSLHSQGELQPLLSPPGTQATHSALLVLLSSPRLLVAMAGLFTLNSFTTAFEGVLPIYLRELFGLNSMQAALMFLAITLPMLLSPLVGKIVDQVGAKLPAAAGFGIAIPGLVLLRLVIHNTYKDMGILVILLFVLGCSVSLAMPPMMTEVTFSIEEQEERHPGIFGPYGAYSQAYGLTNAAFAGGALMGPLYAGFLRESLGWPAMSLFMGALSCIVMLLVLPISGGKRPHGQLEQSAQNGE